MNLKLTMVLFIIAACALCGYSLAGAANEREKFLSELVAALRRLRIYIVDMIMPVEQALKQTDFPVFSAVAARIEKDRSLFDVWRMMAGSEKILAVISDSERKVLDGLFEQLGESGRNLQDEMLRGCIRALELYAEEAKERAGKVCRLYTSVGFLMGLAITILLI